MRNYFGKSLLYHCEILLGEGNIMGSAIRNALSVFGIYILAHRFFFSAKSKTHCVLQELLARTCVFIFHLLRVVVRDPRKLTARRTTQMRRPHSVVQRSYVVQLTHLCAQTHARAHLLQLSHTKTFSSVGQVPTCCWG